jgi:hypothetical protein
MTVTVWQRDRLIRNAALTMGQTFYLCTLNQFVGKNADAWPSQTTLANVMNTTTRSVRSYQTELERLGIIKVEIGVGRGSTNRYRLNLEALPKKAEGISAISNDANQKSGSRFRSNAEDISDEKRKPFPTERTGKEHKKEQAFSFPSELNNEQFKTAWIQWVEYRREMKKRLAPSTASKQLARLATFGSAKSIQAIENSISNGWQGLFDPEKRSGHASDNVEAEQAWQKILQEAKDHHGNAKGFEDAIGPKLAGIVKSLRLSRQVIDQANHYDRREQERQFIQAFSRQGAAS